MPLVFLLPSLLRGDSLTGSTGLFPLDQLQYMALINETGHLHHVLDHFPMFLVSGVLARAGLDVRLAFLVWVPIGVVVLVCGFDLYIRSLIMGARARAAAVALALFGCSPVMAAIYWIDRPAGGALDHLIITGYYFFPAGAVWGYPQIAIALGLMPLCFLAVTDERFPRGVAPAAGAVVSFLHPWQGLTVLLVHSLVALSSRGLRNLRMLLALVFTGVPLAYYWVVERTDPRFALTLRNTAIGTAPLWVLAAALIPLGLAAVGAARINRGSARDQQLVFWPLAGLFSYAAVDASWKPYFLLGITLPLAILTVRGALSLRWMARPRLAAAGLLVLTVPGIVWLGSVLRDRELHDARGVYLLNPGEARALRYVANAPRPGAVLSAGQLAPVAWALTGRESWAASQLTDANFLVGSREAQELVEGELTHRTARRFVKRTGAAFVLPGCGHRTPDLRPWLGPLVVNADRFGCAAVYELRAR